MAMACVHGYYYDPKNNGLQRETEATGGRESK